MYTPGLLSRLTEQFLTVDGDVPRGTDPQPHLAPRVDVQHRDGDAVADHDDLLEPSG